MFSLSFKKSKTVFKTKREDVKEQLSSIISLVIQNQQDISSSVQENPSSLSKIGEYIAVNIGYRYSPHERNY